MTTVTTADNSRGPGDSIGSYLGMTIAIASWSMLFATLLVSYFVLRGRQAVWPPPDLARLPLILPIFNTAILFASSCFLYRSNRALESGAGRVQRRYLLLAIVSGLLFLGLQVLLWRQVSASGIHFSSGALGSVFYMMTWSHAIHIVGGLGSLLYIAGKTFGKSLRARDIRRARMIALFWHFLVIVWLVIFATVIVY